MCVESGRLGFGSLHFFTTILKPNGEREFEDTFRERKLELWIVERDLYDGERPVKGSPFPVNHIASLQTPDIILW